MAEKVRKLNVVWTFGASSDLKNIVAYIARDKKETAKRIYWMIKEKCESLAFFPEQGTTITELEELNITKYRQFVVDVWKILYIKEDNQLVIMALFDSRRDLEKIIFDKLIEKS